MKFMKLGLFAFLVVCSVNVVRAETEISGDAVTSSFTFTGPVTISNLTVINKNSLFRMKVGTFTSAGSTGNQSITGVGFRPRLVKFMSLVPSANTAYFYEGYMDSSGSQWVLRTEASASTHRSDTASNACAGLLGITSAQYVSMDSDGFTLNWTQATAGGLPTGYVAWE